MKNVDFTKRCILIAPKTGPSYHLSVTGQTVLHPFKSQTSTGFFKSSFCRLASRSLEKIYSSDDQRQIVFLGRGSTVSSNQMNNIQEFRSKCFLNFSPWLLKRNSSEENFTDRMSYHLMALRRNRLYGVIRLTPFPFSLHRHKDFPSHLLEEKKNFLEIDGYASLRQDTKLEKMMLLMAAVYSFQKINCDGLVTMTPSSLNEKFLKLGMKESCEKIFLSEFDNIPHSFLSTTFADLFSSPFKLL